MSYLPSLRCVLFVLFVSCLFIDAAHAQRKPGRTERRAKQGAEQTTEPLVDAKHLKTNQPEPIEDPAFEAFGVYQATAPRAERVEPSHTELPLELQANQRIALIGNTLFDRGQHYGQVETLIQQAFSAHGLVFRNLSWSADAIDVQPRPENFADLEQHLTHEQVDVILAAFGFNESFAGKEGLPAFRQRLASFVNDLRTKAFNGVSAPRIVLISPIANEDLPQIPAAKLNNENIELYAQAMREVAAEQQVGFVDVYTPMLTNMQSPGDDLTINGVHLTEQGYELFAKLLFEQLFSQPAPAIDDELRAVIVDKDAQYFRRYRPANTFYYTGGRRKSYGYLDFLPAMRNFDYLVANRQAAINRKAQGAAEILVDDSNLPPLPKTKESLGANPWLTAQDELKEFDIDPRFDVTLFAGEEQFPDIAAPIQMRWDARGRLWVSCSTTYPHVYPGNRANDKLVILEDTDGDGRADKSTVFADDLHIPLSFELGDGGVYVSEMPDLTFLQDTNGDDRADVRTRLLTGFGTEDSHHALHDFVWTPDGDLIFRESIFHHSQIETPYGPVRQQNSGWFRFDPQTHRLTSFGTYPSTNPWGVTFDDWGQHMASHPIYAAAFHALDPAYPTQHRTPDGLQAYSGTCGHEFVDFATFPSDLQGSFIKARYKPTNRIEILKWRETDFGFEEEYVSDLIFSRNLSFIPVDIGFGPRGDLYVCDWYNPIKGHAQYSLRDERRDRHSGRIWRIMPKGAAPQQPVKIAGATIAELLDVLKRPEYRLRYWAKRELRDRDPQLVKQQLDTWVAGLSRHDPRFRHHQLEALWLYRGIDATNFALLRELLICETHLARAAAVEQLRYWHDQLSDSIALLQAAANDPSAIVRMQAVIAASYYGSREALDAMLDVLKHPRGGHLEYAISCALGSAKLKQHWENNPNYERVKEHLGTSKKTSPYAEPAASPEEAKFDAQKNLKVVNIGCLPERMKYTVEQFDVRPGQDVKIVFTNPDATDHNLLLLSPGALEEVGMAANEMARDPLNANSDFIPDEKKSLILHATPMIGPTRRKQVHVLRFTAPPEPGVYPYVCTFPGHWVVMKGVMVVAADGQQAQQMLAALEPQLQHPWKLEDLVDLRTGTDDATFTRGMLAFKKAKCDQCHQLSGHGVNLGPDLSDVTLRYRGDRLLQQVIDPSSEISPLHRTYRFLLDSGQIVTGVIQSETEKEVKVLTNLLLPEQVTRLEKSSIELRSESRVSSMPVGLIDVLTKEEIGDLLSYLQADHRKLPEHHK